MYDFSRCCVLEGYLLLPLFEGLSPLEAPEQAASRPNLPPLPHLRTAEKEFSLITALQKSSVCVTYHFCDEFVWASGSLLSMTPSLWAGSPPAWPLTCPTSAGHVCRKYRHICWDGKMLWDTHKNICNKILN